MAPSTLTRHEWVTGWKTWSWRSSSGDAVDIRVKEYMKHRDDSTVSVIRAKSKVAPGLARVPHSYSQDGRVHFGDKIVLRAKETKGLLAADLGDHIESVDDAYCVTTS